MNIEKIKKLWDEAEKYSQSLPIEERSIERTVGFYDCLCRRATVHSKWISVAKELPDYDTLVIWYREDGIMFIDEIDHDSDWEYFESINCSEFPDDNENISITHWMPLPPSPI